MVTMERRLHKFMMLLFFSSCWLFGESFELVRRFSEGQTWTFEETQRLEISNPAMPGGAQTFLINIRLIETVTAVHEDGSVSLTVKVDKASADQETAFPVTLDYSGLVGKTLLVKLNANAVATSVTAVDDLPDESMAVFNLMKQYYLYLFGEGDFPEKPVSLGESWQHQRAFSLETPMGVIDQVDRLTSTLEEPMDFRGAPCFEVSFEGNFTGTFRDGLDGSLSGEYTGTRLIDRQSGRCLKVEMEIRQQWSQVTHQGNSMVDYHIFFERQLAPNEDSIR